MWAAMGGCYEKMGKKQESVKCLEKAERYNDKEGIALHKLAKLYIIMGLQERAAECFRQNLARKDLEQVETSETVEALLYLAKYYKEIGRTDEAIEFATRLHDYPGTERDEA